MKIGDLVRSPDYKDLDQGRIINVTEIDGTKYYEIYFSKTKDTLTLEEKDLQKITTPLEKLQKQEYDPSPLLKLRMIAEKIDSLIYQDKVITANNFKIVPLPHQVLAVNHVLGQFKPRCLIADEVGLGKTIEAALIYEELKLRNVVKRILIITPAGLTEQWKDEMKTKFNEDFSKIDKNSSEALKSLHGNVNIWKKYDRVITSLDFLKPKALKDSLSDSIKKKREEHNRFITENCINAHWDMVIFDEAHKLSKDSDGAETSRYKIGKSLSETVPIFLLLTATPHQGDSSKFRHLLGLIDEYKFYSPESLNPENVKSVTVKNKKRAATDFKGNLLFKSRITSIVKIKRDEKDIEVELYNEVSKYIAEYYNLASREGNFAFMFLLILYQRMVSSSSRAIYNALNNRLKMLEGIQLENNKPNPNVEDDFEELNGQEAYEQLTQKVTKENLVAIQSKVREEIELLTKCVALAKKTSFGRQDYKIRKTLEIIDEIKKRENNPKTKFLIFTEFVSTQYYLGEILESVGYKVAYLNGRMNLDKKIEAKLQFKEDHQILISTEAGGEGINLQFCHVIINFDLPWNPMRIEQRIGRLDRIGQKKDVLVFNYIIENTVEDRVHEVLQEKLDRIASQFGEDKKADVLNMLQDEFHFDKIYIDALRHNQQKIPDLEKIGEEIFNRAKEILEKQDFLVPFSDKKDIKEIEKSTVENESNIIKNLVETYAKFNNFDFKEYSKKKNIFYTDVPIFETKIKNAVFNKDLAIEDESLDLINITHPLVKEITNELIKRESLTFNIEINKSKEEKEGILFYYRLDLTNNENFLRRFLIPIFIDSDLKYNSKLSEYFSKNIGFEFKTGLNNKKMNDKSEEAMNEAIKSLNLIIKDQFANTKLELIKKIEDEQNKFKQYFKDKENAIQKIAIENIKEAKLKELNQHKISEKIKLDKRKNLVPKIKLIAVAQVHFKRG
ncbi:MAG: DEAD/DEAH box helicase family protein [Nanoarchaeota archaeon]|nr:DEAD/DEAH box helicase family protein [Nanoarchaeota archaeon]